MPSPAALLTSMTVAPGPSPTMWMTLPAVTVMPLSQRNVPRGNSSTPPPAASRNARAAEIAALSSVTPSNFADQGKDFGLTRRFRISQPIVPTV